MENDIYSTVKNFDYDFMGGNNCSNSPWPSCLTIGKAMITIAFLLVVMLVIVLGNTLVVLTVYNDHKLRTQRQNWLIVSLAIADLLVGLIVMPLTTAYEIIGAWRFGEILCEIWLALDVLFVTASILHICIISLDRYWSVTQPLEYPSKRTPFRMSMMIGIAWIVSFLICIPPLFGWRPERDKEECGVSTDLGYVLYSSLGSFYIPVIILVIVYWKIYSITKNHSRQRLKEHERTDKTLIQFQDSKKTNAANTVKTIESPEGNPDSDKHSPDSEHEPVNSTSISKVIPPVGESEKGTKKWRFNLISNKKGEKMYVTMDKHSELRQDFNQCNNAGKRKRLLKAKERQATLLLGLILTAFIASWLPFFVMYVMQAFGVIVPNIIFKFFFWLGNSGINPVIYTLFNREFKRALNRQLKRYSQSLSAMKEGCLLRC